MEIAEALQSFFPTGEKGFCFRARVYRGKINPTRQAGF